MTKTKQINIISYNLKYHRANRELAGLAESYDADVLWLPDEIVLGDSKSLG